MIMINFKKIIIQKKENTKKIEVEKLAKKYYKTNYNISLIRCHLCNPKFCAILTKLNLKNEKGIPDFCYIKNNEIKFIEVKSKLDGIRFHQAEWALKHKDISVIFLWVLISYKIPKNIHQYQLRKLRSLQNK